jgi:hypothetical protein
VCGFIENVFMLTLLIYIITIASLPYVGVYLTYVAVPVIIITGAIKFVFCKEIE